MGTSCYKKGSQFDWPTGDTSCHGKKISVQTRVRQVFLQSATAFFYYKVRWSVNTKCDSFFFTKSDKCYFKERQLLQSVTILLQSATVHRCTITYDLLTNDIIVLWRYRRLCRLSPSLFCREWHGIVEEKEACCTSSTLLFFFFLRPIKLLICGVVIEFTTLKTTRLLKVCMCNYEKCSLCTRHPLLSCPPREMTCFTRELKQPRRRRQQKAHKFAYLTMKSSIFARFARAFVIF